MEFADSRDWGRFVGRVLVSKDAKRILLITVYSPTEASGEGSAWQTQSRAMQGMDSDTRKANSWMQAVHDLEQQVAGFMTASEPQRVRVGTSITIMRDFNARNKHSDNAQSFSTGYTHTLQQMMGALSVREGMQHVRPGASPSIYMQSDKQEANKSWIDFAMASTELLVVGLLTEAGVLQGGVIEKTRLLSNTFWSKRA